MMNLGDEQKMIRDMSKCANWLVLLLCACMFAHAGCGSGEARLLNDLKVVGLDYHNYHDANRVGPANWDELMKNSRDREAVQRVRDAGYQVKWGVKFTEVTEGLANTVLAEKPGGGPKVMMDGSVQR